MYEVLIQHQEDKQTHFQEKLTSRFVWLLKIKILFSDNYTITNNRYKRDLKKVVGSIVKVEE